MSRLRLWYYAQPRALRLLLAINVAVYLLWQVIFIHFDATALFVYRHLALNPTLPGILYQPWQLLTYAFLHLSPGFGGLLHILFNMLWMMWVAREYEQMEGPRKMFALYILGGIGGGLMTVLLHNLFPTAAPFGGVVHGASGAVLAIMMGIAIQYPQRTIALLFIGVVRLIHVALFLLFLDILFLAAGGTSVSAHWGGALTGFLWGRAALAGIDLSGWASVFYPSRYQQREGILQRLEAIFEERSARKGRKKGDRSSSGERPLNKPPMKPTAFSDPSAPPPKTRDETDVDAILDKISEKGYDSLTAAEKRRLYEASKDEE
jgi:membrane associated rhomboid family serine protease